jgi:GTPase
VLFTSGKLEASYLRFIERRICEQFGFVGTLLLHRDRHRQKMRR